MTLAAAVALFITSTWPDLRSVETLGRQNVDAKYDLVVALGAPTKSSWWSPTSRLFVILQNRTADEQPVAIAAIAGDPNCRAQIARMRVSELFISCEGEKETPPWHRLTWDLASQKLTSHEKFLPFGFVKVFTTDHYAVFVGNDRSRLLAVEYVPNREPAFRVLKGTEATPWFSRITVERSTEGPDGHRVVFASVPKRPAPVIPLPRTSYAEFARLRPESVRNGNGPNAELHDDVGPWAREGDKIWFGKTFYDAEGLVGVGGFGYFDTATHALKLLQPPEIIDYSVSAISVSAEDVWMGVTTRSEGARFGSHLLYFDRQTEDTRSIPFGDYVSDLARVGERVVIAGSLSIGTVNGERIDRYFVDSQDRILAFDRH